jgi:hypothetical protein
MKRCARDYRDRDDRFTPDACASIWRPPRKTVGRDGVV